MIKLTNILKEIKIRSANRSDLHSNESLLDFFNQNIKEFIKYEGIDKWYDGDPDTLKLVLRNTPDNKTEIAWDLFGLYSSTHHWLCPIEELPDPGSDNQWVKTEFKGVKFWRLT